MGYDGGTLAQSGSSLAILAVVVGAVVVTTMCAIFSKKPVKQ